MPLQNRVTPAGEIVADPARGLFMGNRGILHDENGCLGKARWRHGNWIICRLEFRGRKRQVMSPRRYTELFFLDEAVALAAGHRPCAECRRERYNAYREAWAVAAGSSVAPAAGDIDAALHAARVHPRSRSQLTWATSLEDLPDGTFVYLPDERVPRLLCDGQLYAWTQAGYRDAIPQPAHVAVTVLTPLPTVDVLAAGYAPELHPSLRQE